jgi:ABC-type transport system substrate-binding protein
MVDDELRGRRLGGFQLIEPLGEGSFATVWRARQLRLDRDVAVKVLDPLVARDPTTARRFEREGRAAAALDHPAIVPVFEAGDDGGLYYLAMRLVRGETLAALLDREGPLSVDRVVRVLGPIADGLDTAHAAGLVHRDVKPANILLEEGRAYLGDFGIAASTRELGRYTTGSLGTAEYMAPEQAQATDVDHRADIYSLACVAYDALTGAPPFTRHDLVSTLVAHASDPIPSTGDARLDAVFAVGLAKSPDDRFESCAALIEALAASPAATRPAVVATPASHVGRWLAIGVVVALIAAALAAWAVGRDRRDGEALTSTPPASALGVAPATTVAPGTSTLAAPPATTPASAPATTPASAPAASEAPAPSAPAAVAPAPRGSVVVGTTLDVADPNPHRSLDTSRVLAEWVLPVMYRVDESLDAEPSLATGPPEPVGGDPLHLRWTIHGDRVWHDGTPVTAADVAATWAYLSAPDTNAANLILYDPVVDVIAIDATTLEVRLAEPHGPAYLMFSTIHPIIQSAAWEAHLAGGGTATDFLDDGVAFSAGPFRVTGRRNAGELSLGLNPAWAGASPGLERVDIVSYPDAGALVDARAVGDVDLIWVDLVDDQELDAARDLGATAVTVADAAAAVQLTLRTGHPALADLHVRQAIALAIDRDDTAAVAVGTATRTAAEPWNSLVFAPRQAGYDDRFGEPDPTAAAALLDAAGWLLGEGDEFRSRDGEQLRLALLLPVEETSAAIVLQEDLRRVGIRVVGEPLPTEQFNQRLSSGDFDLLLQYRLFNNDPVASELTFATYGCPATVPGCSGSGVNVGGFSDPAIDAAFADADDEYVVSQRTAAFVTIDELLAEAVPAVPLYVKAAFTAARDDLTGIEMSPTNGPLATLAVWSL